MLASYLHSAVVFSLLSGAFAARDKYPRGSLVSTPNDYTQNWETTGPVEYSSTPDNSSYAVSWDYSDVFVVGVGWQTGSYHRVVNFDATFSAEGDAGWAWVSVYGRNTNPDLVEYYIQEHYYPHAFTGNKLGTLYSDGSSYTIFETHSQVEKPDGLKNFHQFVSVRDNPRLSGQVTVANHYDAWAKLGLDIGTFGYQIVATEAAKNSGKAQVSVSGGVTE